MRGDPTHCVGVCESSQTPEGRRLYSSAASELTTDGRLRSPTATLGIASGVPYSGACIPARLSSNWLNVIF